MKNKINLFPTKTLAVIILFVTAASFRPAHKFYLGLTEIRVDSKKQTMDVSCKLFTDDLEDALFKKYGKKVNLAASSKNKEVEALLFKYLSENLKINVGGKTQIMTFVGFETETDATWCYLESVPFSSKGKISITNTLLYDYFPEQSNMINFFWDDTEKSAKITNPEKLAEFEF